MEYLPGSFYQNLMDRVATVESVEGGLQDWASDMNETSAEMQQWEHDFEIEMNSRLGVIEDADLVARCGTLETDLSFLNGRVGAAETAINGKAPSVHTHTAAQISNASTIGRTMLTAATADDVRAAIMSPQSHIADADNSTLTGVVTNAPNNAPTNLNVLTTLLGALTGEVNATNGRQNLIADACNTNANKLVAVAAIVKDIAGKLNLTFDALEANRIVAV